MHIFLSPHYDDAVYSCGGTINQLTGRGDSALIITTMGGMPAEPPHTPLTEELHARWAAGASPVQARQAEDCAAAAHVGASVQHIEALFDCVYRTDPETGQALYPTEETLWTTIHAQDRALAWLEREQFGLTTEALTAATRIYAPLGAGAHVDHLIVRQAALAVLPTFRANGADLWLYADYPYIEQPDALRAALDSLPPSVEVRQQAVHLTEPDIIAKIEGVKAYQSQVSTFWESEAALTQRVRDALFIQSAAPAEVYYHLIQQ